MEIAGLSCLLYTSNKIVDSYVISPVTGNPSAFRAAAYVGSSVINKGYITMDGKEYTFAGTVYGVSNTTSFDFDSSYDVFTTKEGYAIGVQGASSISLNDVYYVVGLYKTTSDVGNVSHYAQVIDMDGVGSTIKLEADSFTAMLKKDSSEMCIRDRGICPKNRLQMFNSHSSGLWHSGPEIMKEEFRMRNLKRALSLALASVMLMGMMVVGSSAASYPDVDSQDNLEAIEVMKAVGAMSGDETGKFNPRCV